MFNMILPNLVRVLVVLFLCVILPLLINRTRQGERVPTEISLFSYGYASCAFIDWHFAEQAGYDIYPHYPQDLLRVPCPIILIAIAFLQLLVYFILNTRRCQDGLRSRQIGEKVAFYFLTITLALFSLSLLLTSELLWR